MFYLLFCLKFVLVSSCVTLCYNILDKKDILESHKKIVEANISNSSSISRTGALLSGISELQAYIGEAKNTFILPFFLRKKGGKYYSITPLTKLSDYEKKDRPALLEVIKDIVITNGHLFANGQWLLQEQLSEKGINQCIKIEKVALEARERYAQGVTFANVIYVAFEKIANDMEGVMRKDSTKPGFKKYVYHKTQQQQNKQESSQASDNITYDFFKKIRAEHNATLNVVKQYFKVMETLYNRRKEIALPITYIHAMHPERFTALGMIDKTVQLYQDKGIDVALRFYIESIHILQAIAINKEAEEKIKQAFKNAQQTPTQTVDEVILFIKGPASSKAKTKTDNTSTKKSTSTKNKQKKLQNLAVKDAGRVDDNKQHLRSMLNHKQEELQEANIGLQSVEELLQRFNQDGYRMHNRVLRWYRATPDQIRAFDNNSYASLSEANIMLQKTYHDLKGVKLLLCANDHEDYFFNTPKGKSAFARLEIGDTVHDGMLEIGVCPKKKWCTI